MSVPIGKAGYHLPRTISSAISTSIGNEPESVPISNVRHTHSTAMPQDNGTPSSTYRSRKRGARESPRPPLFRVGRSIIRPRSPSDQPGVGQSDEPERPVNVVTHDHVIGSNQDGQGSNSSV